MADSPMALESANTAATSTRSSTRQIARAPTHGAVETPTSTTAAARRPAHSAMRACSRTQPTSTGTAPVATNPAARPAIVGSAQWGKTLLVPVDTAASGMSPRTPTVRRCVPSPPRTHTADTPARTSRPSASTVSDAVKRGSIGSQSSSGNDSPYSRTMALVSRRTVEAMARSVGIASTRSTPDAFSPASSRTVIAPFSTLSTTVAALTNRRMS